MPMLRIFACIYLAVAVLACALIPLNAAGIVGEPDPLSAIYALFLSLPWSLLTNLLPATDSIIPPMLVCLAGIGVNFALLWKLAAWRDARRARRREGGGD